MKLFSVPYLLAGFLTIGAGFTGSLTGCSKTPEIPPKPIGSSSSNTQATSVDNAASSNLSTDSSKPEVSANAEPGQTAPSGGMPDQGQHGGPGGDGQRGQRMQQMFAQLGLTDAQKQQIKQIRQSTTDRQQRREAIMKILTPEQQAKFQELRQQMGGGHRGRGPRNGGEAGTSVTPAAAPASSTPPGTR